MQNNDTMHYDTCKIAKCEIHLKLGQHIHVIFTWIFFFMWISSEIVTLKLTWKKYYVKFIWKQHFTRYSHDFHMNFRMEFFHRSFHVNIFMWISHAAILAVYIPLSRFRKLLWQDPHIFMLALLHVFVKKMYSHKQSIEQRILFKSRICIKKITSLSKALPFPNF